MESFCSNNRVGEYNTRSIYNFLRDVYIPSNYYLEIRDHSLFEQNDKYFMSYLEQKYSHIGYDPNKSVEENVYSILKNYLEGNTYLNNKELGELASIYLIYKSGAIYTERAEDIFFFSKPIYFRDIYQYQTSQIAYYSYMSDGEGNLIFGKVFVNEEMFDQLDPYQKLEVLLHEGLHALQSVYNKNVLRDKVYSEGEAVFFSELWVREFKEDYQSIASKEYQQYKERYFSDFILHSDNNLKTTIQNIYEIYGIEPRTSKIFYYYYEDNLIEEEMKDVA